MDVLYAIHDCAWGISPVTSYSGVKDHSVVTSVTLSRRMQRVLEHAHANGVRYKE